MTSAWTALRTRITLLLLASTLLAACAGLTLQGEIEVAATLARYSGVISAVGGE